MRAFALLLVAACGKIGFDPTTPVDVGYFISPNGDDANPGTRAEPWLTFAGSIPRLVPGDRLNLLDGDYDAAGPSGSLTIDCSDTARNGTTAAPIVVRADQPRRAHLDHGATLLNVLSCTSWEIDDLWIDGIDDPGAPSGPLVRVEGDTAIVLRGLLLQHANRYFNDHVVDIESSQGIVVENTEIYDFFRAAVEAYLSSAVTLRGVYMNGRGAADLAGGYTSDCPGGDNGFDAYYSRGGIVEDSIVESSCSSAFAAQSGRDMSGDTGLGDNTQFVSDIALASLNGFDVFTDCDASAPCDSPDRIAANNSFHNCAAIGGDHGFELEGTGNSVDHVTAISSTTGISLTVFSSTGGLAATSTATAALVSGDATGITSDNQTTWSVTSSNVFGAATAYSPNDANVVQSTTIDPQLGGCAVYLPPASPMVAAGPNGTPIGADIRWWSQDGAPTTTPFWGSNGTFAGCGAIVAGVNDDPTTSCIGVHLRVNVGEAGCALP